MPRLIKTLAEYAVERRKEETRFMVFNTVYNDLYAFKNEPNSEENAEYGIFGYLNEKCVNNIARDEFINFMKDNFPNTKLEDVFLTFSKKSKNQILHSTNPFVKGF